MISKSREKTVKPVACFSTMGISPSKNQKSGHDPKLSLVDNNVAGLRSIRDDHITTKVL